MTTLAAGGAWLIVQFVVYVAFLRRLPGFRSERVILTYHALSCAVAAAGATALAVGRGEGGAAVLAAVSLHGIYSMSFLCLWSSAQGGFALQILDALSRGDRRPDEVVSLFARTGDTKRAARLASLRAAGFVEAEASTYRVTPRGRWLARALSLLHGLHNFRSVG